MKSLSLARPHILILVGVPGAGKSFFAEHFSETFGAPLISWNHLRYALFNDPTYSEDEDAIIDRVAMLQLDELIKTQTTLVYDGGTGTQAWRQDIVRAAKKAGYDVLYVWVQTDAATAEIRSLKQHVPPQVFERKTKKFTPLKSNDNHVVISGKHTYASQLKIVLRRLSETRTLPIPQAAERPQSRGRSIMIR